MAFDLVGKAVKKLRLPTVNYDSPIKVIPAQQGDVNSRYFVVELYDERGTIDLTPYNRAVLNARLPDDSLQFIDGELHKEDNTALLKIAGSTLSISGKVTCDVSFYGEDSNGQSITLTSQTFYVFVAYSQASDESIEGNDDYSLLLKLLKEVSALEDSIETAESSRVEAETQREESESKRKSQEIARQSAETKRASAENTRASNEDARASAEAGRVTAENQRVSAEAARVDAENKRVSAEKARVSAETQRVNAESSRVNAETARANAETSRETAESSRVEAETQREESFATAKTNCDAATTRANNAADAVQDVLDALPCETQMDDNGTISDIILLKFVQSGG